MSTKIYHTDSSGPSDSSRSLTTDSEESFLLKQLNTSSLSPRDSAEFIKRLSNFRDTFIDPNDSTIASFNIYMDQENIPSLLLFRSPKSGHRRHSYLYELDSNSGVANDGDKKRSIATFSIISSSSSRNNDADNSNSSSQSYNQSNNSTDSNVNRSFKTAKDTFNNSSSGVSSILSKQNSQQQFILHDELVKAEAGDKAHNKSTSSINSNQQPNFIKPILYDSDSSSSQIGRAHV